MDRQWRAIKDECAPLSGKFLLHVYRVNTDVGGGPEIIPSCRFRYFLLSTFIYGLQVYFIG
jgi:hypothetical protein